MSLANNRASMKESNCKHYVTLANALKNKQDVFDYVNTLHQRLGSTMPISKTMLVENTTLQALESDCLIGCLQELQGKWLQAKQEADFERKSKKSQRTARDIIKTGYYPKQWVNEAVQRWTARGKMLFKLGRNVGVPNELKSQYKDFVRQGNLQKIEGNADPTQSNLFLALSAALRKQTPVEDLPTILREAESHKQIEDTVMAEAEPLVNDTASPSESAQSSQPDNAVTTPTPASAPAPAQSTRVGQSSLVTQSAPKVTAPVAASNAVTSTTSTAATHAVDVDSPQNNTNQLETHDLPLDEDTSTPRKKRMKFSLDALADWQQALKEKVIDWTSTNFTLVESVDDIVLADDPSLFVIEEQDGGLVNGSLFRRVMRASAANNRPLRLVWAVAGLDTFFKVCQAITSKGGNLYWRWLASIANPPQNGKLQKSPQLSTIDWIFFGQSQYLPKSLVWHAPTIQEMDEKDKNAFLDHSVFRWPGKSELQQNTSSTTTRDCTCRPVEMYKYIFTETCSTHDCIYDISPHTFAKAFASISRSFAYRAFFEDEQKLLVARDQLVQYILKNIDAEQSTDIVNKLEDTKLVPYSDKELVDEERGRTTDTSTRKRKASKSPERIEELRHHH